MKQPVDEILIALPVKSCYERIQTTIKTCERVGMEAKYLSDFFELSLARPKFEPDDGALVFTLKVVQGRLAEAPLAAVPSGLAQ